MVMETIKKKFAKIADVKSAFSFKTIQLACAFLICFGVVYSILIVPPSSYITFQYYKLDFIIIIFLLCIFTLLIRLNGVWGYTISMTATLSLFFLSLIYKWQTADNFFLLGGLLPQSDAISYYDDAQRLMHGFDMTGAGTYRPIYSSFLAVLMKMASSDLQFILIILVLCNALSVYFAAQEIRHVLKSNFASAVYLILAYMFFRRFSGTLMTENLGFCLGNLAMIFLIRGSLQNRLGQLLYGIFLLTIALNARAGAFLVLPVLAAWLAFSFCKAQGFWRPFLLGCFIILLGMSANLIIARLTISPESKPFSNYSYTLYGIASGNKSWEQAGIDHPGAGANQIYSFAIQKIINKPSLFFTGILGAYRDYFESSNGAFSFLLLDGDRRDIVNIILWFITVIATGYSIIHRKQMELGICLAFLLGIFISLSLVPPADSVKMRAYAATIPLSSYIIAVGAALPGRLTKKYFPSENNTQESEKYLPLILSVLLLVASIILPPFIKWAGKPFKPATVLSCKKNDQIFTFSVASGSSIRLTSSINNTYVPNVMISQFNKKVSGPEQQMSEDEKLKFLNLESGTIITIVGAAIKSSQDFSPPSTIMLLSTSLPNKGPHTLCITPVGDAYYYANFRRTNTTYPSLDLKNFRFQRIISTVQFFVLIVFFMVILIDFSKIKNLLALTNAAILGASLLFILHNFGIATLAWNQQTLDTIQIRHPEGRFLYKIEIGIDNISDTKFNDFPVNLYEDSILLAPQHEGQSMINQYGKGSYILKDNFLFFSTSDNSDPRTNGREYILKWPARMPLRYNIIAYGTFLLSLVMHFLFIKPNRKNINPNTTQFEKQALLYK
jgi:hypothetical protein